MEAWPSLPHGHRYKGGALAESLRDMQSGVTRTLDWAQIRCKGQLGGPWKSLFLITFKN